MVKADVGPRVGILALYGRVEHAVGITVMLDIGIIADTAAEAVGAVLVGFISEDPVRHARPAASEIIAQTGEQGLQLLAVAVHGIEREDNAAGFIPRRGCGEHILGHARVRKIEDAGYHDPLVI